MTPMWEKCGKLATLAGSASLEVLFASVVAGLAVIVLACRKALHVGGGRDLSRLSESNRRPIHYE